jgi:hypothetical protein
MTEGMRRSADGDRQSTTWCGGERAGGGLDSLAYACTTIVVADLDRCPQWYESVLGFTERNRRRNACQQLLFLAGRCASRS